MTNLFLLATQQPELTTEDVAGIMALVMLGLFVVGIMLLINVGINIVICAMLYVAQKSVPAEHRKIDPLAVWLLLIPLFNLVWNFFVFRRIPESYRSYFASQGRTDVGDAGEQIGLWFAIAAACTIVPCLNYLAAPAALILLIIFLVKIFGLRGQIAPQATA